MKMLKKLFAVIGIAAMLYCVTPVMEDEPDEKHDGGQV